MTSCSSNIHALSSPFASPSLAVSFLLFFSFFLSLLHLSRGWSLLLTLASESQTLPSIPSVLSLSLLSFSSPFLFLPLHLSFTFASCFMPPCFFFHFPLQTLFLLFFPFHFFFLLFSSLPSPSFLPLSFLSPIFLSFPRPFPIFFSFPFLPFHALSSL